jgi:hypothetical protein
VPPLVHFVVFVHVVTLSGFNVAVLLTVFDIVIHQITNAANSSTAFVVSLAALFALDSKGEQQAGLGRYKWRDGRRRW